jgi:hypothetical protein
LARVYEDNLIPAVLPQTGRSHPDLYERLLAAGVQPDFPRPKPAQPNAVHGWILAMLFGVLIAVALIKTYG